MEKHTKCISLFSHFSPISSDFIISYKCSILNKVYNIEHSDLKFTIERSLTLFPLSLFVCKETFLLKCILLFKEA